MAGSVTAIEQKRQPAAPPEADFGICVVGCASDPVLGAGALSALYASPAALAADNGIGDGVDCALQALVKTDGNPKPPSIALLPLAPTTPGSMGTVDVSSVTGTAIVSKRSGAEPKGTYETRVRVITGGLIGTAGIELQASINAGREWFPISGLGTASTFKIYLPGGIVDTGAQFDFSPASADLTALNTLINEIYTDFNAHVILTTGTVHGSADSADVVSIASASNTATRIARINALRSAYILHIDKGSTTHLAKDTVNVLLVGAATSDETALALALDMRRALNLHEAYLTSHTIADAANPVTSAAPSAGSLIAGDEWSCPTLPPMFATADLYAAGTPATGALAVLAQSAQQFAIVAISEPVATADFSTLVAGLDYARTFGKRWLLMVRFRDPNPSESDAAYVAAFRVFATANQDNRIQCVVGSGWLTEPFTGRVYLRSGLPAVLARLQSFVAVPGQLGERMTQHPGWVGRGPLENFSIHNSDGGLVGHDEATIAGVDGPVGAFGGGLTFFYLHDDPQRAGTYVSEAPVMYPIGSEVLTSMDRRIVDGVESVAVSSLYASIQGADIIDAANQIDPGIVDALASKTAAAIANRYPREFANPQAADLVTIDPTATKNGSQASITGTARIELFFYDHDITINISAIR